MGHTSLRVKQKRFADNDAYTRFVKAGQNRFDQRLLAGKWSRDVFGNDKPLVLELAAGRAEFSTGLAAAHPDQNYIAVDIKGHRLWYGVQCAIEQDLDNVAFLRILIHDIGDFFSVGEVSEIRVVHPDPRPKGSDAKRRLTHPRFLDIYRQLLTPSGILHIRTDDHALYTYTMDQLQMNGWIIHAHTEDIYQSSLAHYHHGITTHYERMFVEQGRTVHYIQALVSY